MYYARDSYAELNPLNLGGSTVENVTQKNFELTESPACFEAGTQNIAGYIGLGSATNYVGRIGTVSYTHLDVYKRQLLRVLFYHHRLENQKNLVGLVFPMMNVYSYGPRLLLSLIHI